MALNILQEQQQVHEYVDKLPPAQLIAVRQLLESMVDPLSVVLANAPEDDEELTEEEAEMIRDSQDWFKHNQGTSFEDVVAELGFTMDDIRNLRERA